MIPNLTSAILLTVIGTIGLILILFLPAFLELRKPKDRGPRMIMNDFHGLLTGSSSIGAVVNIEEEQWFDRSLLMRLLKVIEVLPCLEV
jgi:hypothetical protein